MGFNDFCLSGVGERFENEDGSSRQAELALCQRGDPIRLVREPDNRHDSRAVAIVSERGVRVGYLGRDRAAWMASKIDRGFPVRAIIDRIKGAHLPGSPLGIVVRINMDGDAPELDDASLPSHVMVGAAARASVSSRPNSADRR